MKIRVIFRLFKDSKRLFRFARYFEILSFLRAVVSTSSGKQPQYVDAGSTEAVRRQEEDHNKENDNKEETSSYLQYQ